MSFRTLAGHRMLKEMPWWQMEEWKRVAPFILNLSIL